MPALSQGSPDFFPANLNVILTHFSSLLFFNKEINLELHANLWQEESILNLPKSVVKYQFHPLKVFMILRARLAEISNQLAGLPEYLTDNFQFIIPSFKKEISVRTEMKTRKGSNVREEQIYAGKKFIELGP